MITSDDQRLFREVYESADEFVITTHLHPDGDAIGSQIGLCRFLASLGKRARLINVDPSPDVLGFLQDDAHPVEIYDPARHDPVLRDAKRILLVDNSAPDRLGRMEQVMLRAADRVLCIDHHPSRETPWAELILDESSCATAVMIYELVSGCGWQPDARAAEAIYVGVATDTGFFRFNSTNAQAHAVAADLLRLGARPAKAYEAIYERNTEAFTRLLGHSLVEMVLYEKGRMASVALTRKLIEQLGAQTVDTSEIISTLLALDGIRVALLFRELPDGKIKVSLRSKGPIDVHAMATEYGGGGHRNASGIVIEGALRPIVEQVTDRARALLNG